MINIIKVKGCTRCGGDLYREKDSVGNYICCLQCGAVYATLPVPRTTRSIMRRVYAR